MKQEEIFKKVGAILNELNEQYQFIEKTMENINDLELELFAANTHYLAENIEVLRKHNRQRGVPPMPAEAPPFTERFFEPVVQPAPMFWPEKKEAAEEPEVPEPEVKEETVIIRHKLDMADIDVSSEDEEEEQPAAEVNADPEDIAYVEEVTGTPAPQTIPAPPVIEKNAAPADKPSTTINEIIAARLASTRVADKFELPAITDLKSAINLNDKLLYVKELFNGYSMAYSEAVDILNRFNKFDEADAFLKANYVKKNSWETKQATVDKFYTLLRRRFPN